MKRVIIVHGWHGFPEKCWFPQTKKSLEENGFHVTVPQMPGDNLAKLSAWLNELKKIAGQANEDLFLVGHSLGCITILKFLEQLKDSEKIGGVVLVAGFTASLGRGYEPLENFIEAPVNLEKVKTKSKFFLALHSDNDPRIPAKYGDIFQKKLGAKLIIMHNMGHFSGNPDDPKTITSLPIVTEEILRMSSSSSIIAQ